MVRVDTRGGPGVHGESSVHQNQSAKNATLGPPGGIVSVKKQGPGFDTNWDHIQIPSPSQHKGTRSESGAQFWHLNVHYGPVLASCWSIASFFRFRQPGAKNEREGVLRQSLES
eukprot:gene8764-biopygen1623